MSIAPLARTLLMKEGSAPGVITAPIKIPTPPLRDNLETTLAGSPKQRVRVAGAPELFAARAADREAVRVRFAENAAYADALAERVAKLEA